MGQPESQEMAWTRQAREYIGTDGTSRPTLQGERCRCGARQPGLNAPLVHFGEGPRNHEQPQAGGQMVAVLCQPGRHRSNHGSAVHEMGMKAVVVKVPDRHLVAARLENEGVIDRLLDRLVARCLAQVPDSAPGEQGFAFGIEEQVRSCPVKAAASSHVLCES